MENPPPEASQPVEELYAQLRHSLLAFLRKHTGDAHAAEDLLHDVVLKALAAGRGQTAPPDNLAAWLYAVARNAAMDFHRRSRRTEELPEDLEAPADDRADQDYLELANCLRPMAERLPPKYRETVIAADFDGTPLRQLADAEELTVSAIKSRASRGRRLLQQELVACCRVVLSDSGQVLDYDPRAAQQCAPAQDCQRTKP